MIVYQHIATQKVAYQPLSIEAVVAQTNSHRIPSNKITQAIATIQASTQSWNQPSSIPISQTFSCMCLGTFTVIPQTTHVNIPSRSTTSKPQTTPHQCGPQCNHMSQNNPNGCVIHQFAQAGFSEELPKNEQSVLI
jgi:hypothetical protein